jgi:uncharacterized cupin superfamily protein
VTTIAEQRLVAVDVATMPLTTESHSGLWVTGGWPAARTDEVARVGDARISVWETTEGVVDDIERDELLVVVAGAGAVRFDDGERVELRPGLCLRLVAGERAEWTVAAPLRVLSVTTRG